MFARVRVFVTLADNISLRTLRFRSTTQSARRHQFRPCIYVDARAYDSNKITRTTWYGNTCQNREEETTGRRVDLPKREFKSIISRRPRTILL